MDEGTRAEQLAKQQKNLKQRYRIDCIYDSTRGLVASIVLIGCLFETTLLHDLSAG